MGYNSGTSLVPRPRRQGEGGGGSGLAWGRTYYHPCEASETHLEVYQLCRYPFRQLSIVLVTVTQYKIKYAEV